MQAISLHTAAVLATVFTSSLSVRTNNLSTLMSRGVVAARQEIADPPSEDEIAASEAKAREIYDRAVSVARSLKTLDLVVKSDSDADSGGNPSGAARVRMEFDLAGEFAISRLRVDIAEDGGDPENPSFTVVLNEEGAIGLDFTERFNASVLAAPNRSDVPPQLNLNLKASELLNLQGAIDAQGAWQTQLQLFFRF